MKNILMESTADDLLREFRSGWGGETKIFHKGLSHSPGRL